MTPLAGCGCPEPPPANPCDHCCCARHSAGLRCAEINRCVDSCPAKTRICCAAIRSERQTNPDACMQVTTERPLLERRVVDQPYPLGVASGAFIPNATVSYGYQVITSSPPGRGPAPGPA